jgi:tetratricopeptide (TPR) repeat protein
MTKLRAGAPLLLLILVLALNIGSLTRAAELNWASRTINQAWLNVTYPGAFDNSLQDSVPDGWVPANWRNSLAVLTIDHQTSRTGRRSAHIQKNNDRDASVFEQSFAPPPGKEVQCGVYSLGDAAFLGILGDGIQGRNYTTMPESDEWVSSTLRFTTPAEGDIATLYFGLRDSTGKVWFDDAFCRETAQGSGQLIENGGFEADGTREDPEQWWTVVRRSQGSAFDDLEQAYSSIAKLPEGWPARVSRLNAADLLLGRNERVVARMQHSLEGCVGDDRNPDFLLGLGANIQPDGGLSAYERAIQLAILLMPNCPQPYAELAELYSSAGAYDRAASLYEEAASRARPGAQRSAYLFTEGRIHVISTGDWNRAIDRLSRAQLNTDWANSDHGVATLYLGNALVQAGRCDEARLAYQTVLGCGECTSRHAEALSSLNELKDCVP